MNLIFLFSIILTINLLGQDKFEPGYILLNNGTQIDGLINNEAWKNTPLDFEYKINQQTASKRIEIKEISEISIPEKFKFIRRNVMVGFPEKNINELTYDKNLALLPMSLFLEVLVEGETMLYQHKTGKHTLFFYENEGQDLEQLVFKRYKFSTGIKENARFRQQLWLNMRCNANGPIAELDGVQYNEKSLKKYFLDYYDCVGRVPQQVYQNNEGNKLKLNIYLTPGLSLSRFKVDLSGEPSPISFNPKPAARLGVDLEFVLPYNNGRWALFLDPNIYGLNQNESGRQRAYEIRYLTLEVPFGIRHYFFLKDGQKVFANLLIQNSFTANFSSVVFIERVGRLPVKNGVGFAAGVGYRKNRFALELRAYSNRAILQNYIGISANVSPLLMLVSHYRIN